MKNSHFEKLLKVYKRFETDGNGCINFLGSKIPATEYIKNNQSIIKYSIEKNKETGKCYLRDSDNRLWEMNGCIRARKTGQWFDIGLNERVIVAVVHKNHYDIVINHLAYETISCVLRDKEVTNYKQVGHIITFYKVNSEGQQVTHSIYRFSEFFKEFLKSE